jgi:membrane fusion protein (multidrug efflux system)
MKRTAIFSLTLLAFAVLIGGFGYFHFVAKPELIRQALSSAVPPPVTITAEPARLESWERRLPAIGTLRAVQGVDVATQVDGIVRAIRFRSGEEVLAGAVLVELDDSVEQADLKSAMAELRKTTLEFERQRELLARGNTPRANFDTAQAQRDTAAALIERIRAVIAKKAIRAPFDGRLGINRIDLGQYLPVGATIVTLQRLDPIHIDFWMPEQSFAVLRVGQPVEVAVDAYPGEVFAGAVQSLDAKVSAETRTFLVRAEIANPDRRLLPGMFANVSVIVGAPQEVVTLPRTAVTYSLYGDSVFVVLAPEGAPAPAGGTALFEEGIVERRFVRLGEVRGDRVAVVSGVKSGETAVTSGQVKLEDKARVRVDNAAELRAPSQRPAE